jgi:hypothetical protein
VAKCRGRSAPLETRSTVEYSGWCCIRRLSPQDCGRAEVYARDISTYCGRLQIQPVLKSTSSDEDLAAIECSPFVSLLKREGWSAASAIVAGVVCCVDWNDGSPASEDVHKGITWLRTSITSPDSWKCASSRLTALRPTDTRRFEVHSSREPPQLKLPELQGGTWRPSPFEILRCCVEDVGKRLLVLHGPSRVVQPAVVIAFACNTNNSACRGHQLLFDNGDVRW